MTSEKPSRNEDEYFARQDAELMRAQRARVEEEEAAAERRRHFMKCPKDGYDLTTVTNHGVQVDTCSHCGGIWLDAGELEQLAGRDEPGLLGRVVGDLFTGFKGRGRTE